MPKHQTPGGKKALPHRTLLAMVSTALLAALAFVLMQLDFATPLAPPFLKLDISDMPALLASFVFGPLYGLAASGIKCLLHAWRSNSFGVGELSNFILCATFVGVAGALHKALPTRGGAATSALLGGLAMALICVPANYFIVYPFYARVMHIELDTLVEMHRKVLPFIKNLWQALLVCNLPFTFLKSLLSTSVALAVYLPLKEQLRRFYAATPSK